LRKIFAHIFVFLILAVQSNTLSAQFKPFVRGLQGKDSLSMSKVLFGTMILPGYGQAYNRDYWKIPVVYAGMGGGIAAGLHFNSKLKNTENTIRMLEEGNFPQDVINAYSDIASQHRHNRNLSYLAAGTFYIAGAIDAVASYKTNKKTNPISPQRATLYSALLPGLGQMYNGDYWKIPIIYGGLGFCVYWADQCDSQYKRYRTAYNKKYAVENGTSTELDEFGGRYSLTTLKNAREMARRNRDLTILATSLVYILNIVDANVFAHLSYFDINDNISLRCEPMLFNEATFASGNISPSAGIRLQLKF
jgi:hypothetical protein